MSEFSRKEKAILLLVLYPFCKVEGEDLAKLAQTTARHTINNTMLMMDRYDLTFEELPDYRPFITQFQADVAVLEAFGITTGSHSKQLIEYHFKEPCLGWDVTSAILYSGILDEQTGDALTAIVQEAVAANPKAAEDIRAGKDKAIGTIFGYVMKKVKVDPTELRAAILAEVNK
jgi:Asp-tRNA(Asn)/Glu-tRNA(Gln) amidotransferase B subunit